MYIAINNNIWNIRHILDVFACEKYLYDEDFMKTIMNYIMFQSGVDAKELETVLVSKVMYSSKITKSEDNSVAIQIEGSGDANG